jgi:Ion channel
MRVLAIVGGLALVITVITDLVNTLVATNTAQQRWWLTRVVYQLQWGLVRGIAARMQPTRAREGLLSVFAPVSILVLLAVWAVQQIIGFGLIWWGMGGIQGVSTLGDAIYYSGVVYFTVGFGEVVPAEVVPRFGALLEAFSGVLTTALVIGYLPALYSAYSERERMLMLLDAGTEERITPTNLVIARAPDGDIRTLDPFFQEWEHWIAGVVETHGTFPMLALFRSKAPGQHWVTALGLVSDAALHSMIVRGSAGRAPYWMLRRSINLFQALTRDVDLSPYEAAFVNPDGDAQFRAIHREMTEHGFDVLPFQEAAEIGLDLRRRYAPALEYLIDALLAPRGFWGHEIGHRLSHREHISEGEE